MTENERTSQPRNQGGGGLTVGKIVSLVAIVIALIFIGQNSQSGSMSFLFWEFTLPTWVWAGGLFILGGIAGYSFCWSRARARRKARRQN